MFRNDYSEPAPKEVLEALLKAANEQNVGYGLDMHSDRAAELIKKAFALKNNASIHFLAGGTQANMAVISYLLRPYEGVITVDTGHINVHETAAVEGSGHKIFTVPNEDGKLLPEKLEEAIRKHTDEHMMKPKMVYLSDATETGTVYQKSELRAIKAVCEAYGLYLFIDGARLGVALTNEDNDIRPEDLKDLCDVFYIGGTKNGALFGEAVVFCDGALGEEFRYHIKNRGAMLAKGFVPGIMFETLFEDGLYFRLAAHSNAMAKKLREGFCKLNVELVGTGKTNQIFLRLPNQAADLLMDHFGCELWTPGKNTQVVRVVTSFATREEACDELLEALKQAL